jgi:hypothetical protein
MTKTSKSLALAEIKPITKSSKGFSGGLEDLGNFKEGFCLKIISSDDDEWVVCTDNMEEKENFMEALAIVKGKATIFSTPDKKLEGTATLEMGDFSSAPIPYE